MLITGDRVMLDHWWFVTCGQSEQGRNFSESTLAALRTASLVPEQFRRFTLMNNISVTSGISQPLYCAVSMP